MKNKITIAAITMIFVVSLLTACQGNTITIDPIEQLIGTEQLNNIHTNRLVEKETPYTMCFENSDDTVSVYIFTSPIAFYDSTGSLESIDTTLVSVADTEIIKKGYSLEPKSCDIKSYFPKNLQETPFLIQGKDNSFSFSPDLKFIEGELQKSIFTDLIDRDHTSVIYQNGGNIQIEYIPTTAGIMANITINEKPESNQIDFYIDQQENIQYSVKDNQYIVFKTTSTENITKAVVYTSFLQDFVGNSSFNNAINIIPEDDKWKYSITLDEGFLNDPSTQYPLTISPTFELYRNKMPDSTVYSNKPFTNVYLANYAVMGNNDFYGSSQHYLRFRINYVFKSYEQNVRSAVYVTTAMLKGSESVSIDMLRLKDIWSSTGINWNSKYTTYDKESTTQVYTSGRYEFDITEFVKVCVEDAQWNTEVYGLVMTAAENSSGINVVATSDNTFYQPYVLIDFYDLPWTFEELNGINPNTGF